MDNTPTQEFQELNESGIVSEAEDVTQKRESEKKPLVKVVIGLMVLLLVVSIGLAGKLKKRSGEVFVTEPKDQDQLKVTADNKISNEPFESNELASDFNFNDLDLDQQLNQLGFEKVEVGKEKLRTGVLYIDYIPYNLSGVEWVSERIYTKSGEVNIADSSGLYDISKLDGENGWMYTARYQNRPVGAIAGDGHMGSTYGYVRIKDGFVQAIIKDWNLNFTDYMKNEVGMMKGVYPLTVKESIFLSEPTQIEALLNQD